MAQVDEDGLARFTTTALPGRERIEASRAFFGSAQVGLEVRPLEDRRFAAEAKLCPLPEVAVGTVDIEGGRLERSRARIAADGKKDFALAIVLRGGSIARQCGRELEVGASEAVLTTDSEWASVTYPRDTRFLVLQASRKALCALVPNADDAVMRPIDGRSEPLKHLAVYARMIQDGRDLSSPAIRALTATHLLDLTALSIGASRDAAAVAEGRGLRAARLNAIKADILDHLVRPELTIDALAARHSITPRYIGKLFETEGTTFSDYVRNQRLERARRRLSDPRFSSVSISVIAFESGFNDLSYFSRCFRSRYGAPPGDMREAARPRTAPQVHR